MDRRGWKGSGDRTNGDSMVQEGIRGRGGGERIRGNRQGCLRVKEWELGR